ncbi:MAG: M1 family metallopeptidase [Planctomycetota bacterium]
MIAAALFWVSCLLVLPQSTIEVPPPKLSNGKFASGGPLLPEQAAYDVSHYDLTLRVDPAQRRIDGTLTVTAKVLARLDRLVLDLDDALTVQRCESERRELAFKHRGGLIAIGLGRWYEPGSSLAVAVAYGGKPRVAPHAPWDGGFTWATTPSGKPWIATTCQMDGADLWWPCKDHPSDKAESFDLRITVPRDLVCAANGKLLEQTDGKGTRTFHWRLDTPVSNYCIALNIAPYELIHEEYTSVTGEKVPVFFYVLPEHVEQGRKALPGFLRDMRVFEELCGPYPFRAEKYGVVETPHLGMEHATITAYGNQFRADPDGYDWLHNHEFAHEWWANLVTCRDWKDMWIHEGIGTYMQPLFLERTRGKDAYFQEMRNLRRFPNRRAIAPREVQDSRQIYGNDIYNKGAWFMHELRWLMGDAQFFVALRRMAYPDPRLESVTDGSQVRFADTEEIRTIAEHVFGQDLAWIFEVYLRQAELPELVVEQRAAELCLTWKAPGQVAFPLPVPVRVNGAMQRILMPEGHAVVPLTAGAKVDIDPEGWLLRKS